MWIGNNRDIFLLRNMPFKNAVVSNQESYRDEVFKIAESSFNHVDLYTDYDDGLDVMLVAVFASNYDLIIDNEKFEVSFGDCLITTTPQKILSLEPEFVLLEIEFYFTRNKKQVGTGSKEYSIISVVRDEYKINVFADSLEEAISLASEIPPSKWEHLEVDTHLEERTMVRMARWGNFTAKEVL